jgi:hypothetical protein
MSVYVDTMRAKFGRMVMCHMIADTIDELHTMATAIGVRRKWFQDRAGMPHYDICIAKRALAVSFGAVEIEWRDVPRKLREIAARNKSQTAEDGA